MAKKIISYKLNEDGTIPDFVEDGGYLPKDSNDTPNMVLVGIAKDGADITNAVAEFPTKEDALAYVSTYLSDESIVDPVTGITTEYVVEDAIKTLFAKIA